MKQTAWAPANIAFIKYWGKRDDDLRLPLNASISMNLSGAYTVTTVEFSPKFEADSVELLGGGFSEQETRRVINGLDRMRERAGRVEKAKVMTKNTFHKGAGSAASASGFAALTVAGFAALGMNLTEKELTLFARMGSGSACRSIPDGFVEWQKGTNSEDSYAYSLYPSTYWDIQDILVIVDSRMKKVSTTEGMETVGTSPFISARLVALPERLERCRKALQTKNFRLLGMVAEEDCLDMHRVMQSQTPALMYWNETTRTLMDAVIRWRERGIPVYFTIDAGPNVHVLCEGKDEISVLKELKLIKGVESVIRNAPSKGAHAISEHLF